MFSFLTENQLDTYFYVKPSNFTKYTDRNTLAYAIGATLYSPATRENLIEDLINKKHAGLSSMVFCLEDAIGDFEVDFAEKKIIEDLQYLQKSLHNGYVNEEDLPLLFLRIRNYEQMMRLVAMDKSVFHLLTGINIPKFSVEKDRPLMELIKQLNEEGILLYALPILETKEVIEIETRITELMEIKKLVDEYQNYVLNIRIGATDFCGLYGIRRNSETTVYDIHLIRDCIADITNVFLRSDCPYVVSGPVWEYFVPKERLLKPQLRQTPFIKRIGLEEGHDLRENYLNEYMDGFIREILMDITNGIVGKTIIHPTHIKPVQALNAVSFEEYMDAMSIINQANGEKGVSKSLFSNKMNEMKPHYFWATKILMKAQIYGVLNEQFTYFDILFTTTENVHTT